MDRIATMNVMLIWVIISAWTILDHVALSLWINDIRLIWIAYVLIHFLAGIFLGTAMFKAGEGRLDYPMIFSLSILIILINTVLTAKLVSSLAFLSGKGVHIRNVLGAAAAMSLGFGIPSITALFRSRSGKAIRDEGFPVDLKITDVIVEETGIRCPICDIFPEDEGHYIIRCYHCNAEFCSKHLEQYENRCWRCRTPVPFLKELKRALEENRSI